MKTQCSSCKSIMPVKNPAVFGKTKTCPKCGNPFRVEEYGADSFEDDDELGPPEPPRRKKSRSKRKASASGGSSKQIVIGVAAVTAVVLIGAMLGGFFSSSPQNASPVPTASSGDEPEAAADLSADDSLKKRRSIGLAMHNYSDTHRFFPHPVKDDVGREGLSWRVHLLPFFPENEMRALYEEFHLDEPWNSVHNRTLIERMPAAYESRGVKQPGFTGIRIVAGKGTGEFSKARTFFQVDAEHGPSFRDATDGASNTLLFLEVGPQEAVEWTKPEVVPFVCNAPMSNWGDTTPGHAYNIVLCDGRALPLNAGTGARETATVLLCNDGNVVELQKMESRN